jgi:hypothetical protein
MNYLNAINRVLRRLREDEVSSVTSTAYAKLVGDYVNDAVRLVEDSWDWSVLRTTDSRSHRSKPNVIIRSFSVCTLDVCYSYGGRGAW